MGLFGNSNIDKIELAKELAHNANDANVGIGEVLLEFEENSERFNKVSDNILDLSQRIISKISNSEMRELTDLTEVVCDLHKEYLKSFQMVTALSKEQIVRTKKAIEKYERISRS